MAGNRRSHLFNEIMVLSAIYNLVLFTPFVINKEIVFMYYGNSFIGILALLTVVNFGWITLRLSQKVIIYFRRRAIIKRKMKERAK